MPEEFDFRLEPSLAPLDLTPAEQQIARITIFK